MMYKISILIPIYNVEKYLHQCLNSVVNQTLKDIEIICINDGSTDHSLDIIKEFASKDSRIKVIDKKNTGYGHSMNQGLKLAQGEYIGIVESDDFAELNMFETLYNTANNTEAEVVKSNYWSQAGGKFVYSEYLKKQPYEKIFSPRQDNPQIFNCFPNIWSGIYNREFLLKNNIDFNETPGASYQDVAFIFKVWACAEKVFLIKEAFLHYRRDNPNSSVKSPNKAYCIFDEFNEIKRFLSNHKDFSDPCNYMFSVYKYNEFESNFRRIDDKFKFEFYKRIVEEFENDNANGYLNKNYWWEDKWNELQSLLSDKKEFFYKQYAKLQKNRAYLVGFVEKLNLFKNIYIYGAGKIALSVLFKLYQRGINIKGLIVSDINDNPDNLLGVPVSSIKDTTLDKEKDLILIAITEEYQYDLFYQLQSFEYHNIIVMDKELRKALV